MISKILSMFTVALAVFAFGSFASAQNSGSDMVSPSEKNKEKFGRMRGMHGGKKGMRTGGAMMRGLRGVDLTDTQKEQIKSLHESFRASHQGLHEEMRSLAMKKRDGSLTETEQARMQEIKNTLQNDMQQMHNSVLALLTPEQRQQIEQQKAERRKRMEERRQRFRERRQNSPSQDN